METLRHLKSVEKWIFSRVFGHFSLLVKQCDPIQTLSPDGGQMGTAHSSNYYFPLFIVMFTGFFGTFYLHYEATGDVEGLTNWTTMNTSPYPFVHQICPESIRSQMDFGLWIDIFASIAVYSVLIFTRGIPARHQIYHLQQNEDMLISFGSKILGRDESMQILQLRKRYKTILLNVVRVFWASINTFFFINVWINSAYQRTLFSLLFWTVSLPLFVGYILYSLFASPIYVILASRYIRIRQKVIVKEMQDVIEKICAKSKSNRQVVMTQAWRQYMRANEEAIQLCQTIRHFIRFCRPLISVTFPYYISVQCYLIYILLYINVQKTQKLIFYMAVGNLNLFLFVIIHECAHTAKYGRRLEVLNLVFYLKFLHKGGFGLFNNAVLVKAQTYQTYRRFHTYAFKLVGNYRITQKTYYLILSYISAFFVFMSKKIYH